MCGGRPAARIRSVESAYSADGGLAVLTGNLAPDGAVARHHDGRGTQQAEHGVEGERPLQRPRVVAVPRGRGLLDEVAFKGVRELIGLDMS